MKLKKLFAMLMALAMVAGLLAACSNDTGNASTPPASEPVSDSQAPESDAPESEAPALDPVTLNVAYMPNYGSLWVVIAAQELGYFEDEAITVNLMSFDSGPVIISAMESGSVDFGYIGDGAHKLCVQGQASIIGLSHISNGDAVIGGPNVTTLEDLKGKTVAYSSGTSSETILTNALNSVGLTMADITPMDMDAANVVTAMLSGGVDACAIWSPQSLTILDEMEGATKLAQNTDFSDISISLASWIAMPEYLEAHHDVAVRFMRALLRAMDYAALEENYEEVSGWVADFLALDVEDVLIQARGDADWLTGKEVLAGIDDGTVDGYYELQQEMMVSSGAITEDQKCPVSDYVIYDIIKEAGNY